MLCNDGSNTINSYRHKLTIYNTFYFSTTIVVTRTRPIITFIRTSAVLLKTDTIEQKLINGYRLTSKGTGTVTVSGGVINI